jgi:hypothetical protein
LTRQDFRLAAIRTEMLRTTIMMLYSSTSDGQVLRLARDQNSGTVSWIELNHVIGNQPIRSLDVSNSYLVVTTESMVSKFPKTSCQQMLNCRDCWNLGDPRCYWSSSGCLPRILSGSQHVFKLPDRNDANCPAVPEEEASEAPPAIPRPHTSDDECADCGAAGEAKPETSVTVASGVGEADQQQQNQSVTSGFLDDVRPGLKVGLLIGVPTFLVGIVVGMGMLFLYAYCKAQCNHHQALDPKEDDCEDNVYETARYEEARMQPMGNRMFPNYFKADHQAMQKDYEFLGQMAQQDMANGSPLPPNAHMPNGHLPNGMVLNGYPHQHMPGNPGQYTPQQMHPPAPPPRPRNFSHSTSSDGLENDTNSLRAPAHDNYDGNRLLYQVPRGNNRFSAHEYEAGDSPMTRETMPMVPENEHSLRRQTLPRNGHATDQHIGDLGPDIQHNSLPRKVPLTSRLMTNVLALVDSPAAANNKTNNQRPSSVISQDSMDDCRYVSTN